MDKKTTDQIIVEYSKKIFGFAMKKSFSYDEAKENDISLETIIDLLKNWYKYDKGSGLLSYLYQLLIKKN